MRDRALLLRNAAVTAPAWRSTWNAPPVVQEVLRSPGEPLDASTRTWMELGFGQDFSRVRVHTGERAAASARAVQSFAYSVGREVVFGAGQYAPRTPAGRRLLAHELAHVAQSEGAAEAGSRLEIGAQSDPMEAEAESAAEALARGSLRPWSRLSPRHAALRLRRARFQVGSLPVRVDYSDLVDIPASGYQRAIETSFTAWTRSPAWAIRGALAALTAKQQRWVLFALDLLEDNTTDAHRTLNRAEAVKRLVARARTSGVEPGGGSSFTAFEQEVLQVSGWFEVAFAAGLAPPTGPALTELQAAYKSSKVEDIYEPGPPSPDKLDRVKLAAELKPALRTYLEEKDPGASAAPETQSMETLGKIADLILEEARSFFAPYADTAIKTVYSAGWRYSAHITPPSTPTFWDRVFYLENRSHVVGDKEDKSGTSIFSRCGFKSDRDGAELRRFVGEKMLREPGITPIVDRHILYTPRAEREGVPTVYLQPKYQLPRFAECIPRWKSIDQMTHELVHVMEHKELVKQEEKVEFQQLVREGFTEVLGLQLYHHVRQRAINDPDFRAKLEEGLPLSYSEPPEIEIGYGAAGPRAEEIRRKVGDDNFRAAYFLGAIELVGLEKEKKP